MEKETLAEMETRAAVEGCRLELVLCATTGSGNGEGTFYEEGSFVAKFIPLAEVTAPVGWGGIPSNIKEQYEVIEFDLEADFENVEYAPDSTYHVNLTLGSDYAVDYDLNDLKIIEDHESPPKSASAFDSCKPGDLD